MKRKSVSKAFIAAALSLAATLVGCRSGRPEPFLNEREMSELLTEIRVAEAVLYNRRVVENDGYSAEMERHSMDVYESIFKKYGINYDQYIALMNYYMAHPEKLKAVSAKSADDLKKRVAEMEAADDAAAGSNPGGDAGGAR